MKLTSPLRLPDIFNIYSAISFLKENDIVFSLIKPGRTNVERIPRTLGESNLKFIYSFSNGTFKAGYVYKYFTLQLRID